MAAKLIMKRKRQQDEVRCYNEIINQNASEHENGNETANIGQFMMKAAANENHAENYQQKRSKLTDSPALTTPLYAAQHDVDIAATETASPHSATPPPAQPLPPSNNAILMEALQKIIELQAELDEFEHDLDESEYNEDAEVSFYLEHEHEHAQQQARMQAQQDTEEYRRHEAEALGFAMCARETMLFLQREGISSDSVLYRSLHQRLVGQSDDVIPI